MHYQGPGGDGDPNKAGVQDKGAKSQSPFEGEVKAAEAQDVKELQNSNGIMQNGLEDRCVLFEKWQILMYRFNIICKYFSHRNLYHVDHQWLTNIVRD